MASHPRIRNKAHRGAAGGKMAAAGMAAADAMLEPKRMIGGYPDPLQNRLKRTELGDLFRMQMQTDRRFDAKASEEEWLRRIGEKPRELMNVPPGRQTKRMVLAAVSAEPVMILAAADHLLDRDVAMAAVKNAGMILDMLPPDLASPEVCMEAVKQNPAALGAVPEKLKTPETCEIAVRKKPLLYQISVPDRCKTHAVNLAAVRGSVLNYDAVPEGMRTPELRGEGIKGALALAENPPEKLRENVLYLIHSDLRTREVCLAGLKSGAKFDPVPQKLADDPAFRMEAVKLRPSVVKEFENATKQEWQAACLQDPELYENLPAGMRNMEFFAGAAAQSPSQIFDVPSEVRTAEFYKETGYEMLRGLARKLAGEERTEAAGARPGA